MKYDSILLAGGRGNSKKVLGQNKAYLDIKGYPIVLYVLAALDKASLVDRIFVIGDSARLARVINAPGALYERRKPLVILEQRETLYENGMYAYLRTFADKDEEVREEDILGTPGEDKAAFLLSSDIPLITHYEIDSFLESCSIDGYDYFLGMTGEEHLKHYYPTRDRLGVRMAYFQLREGRARQNNLHLVKPLKIDGRAYIQEMYKYRYQRQFRNMAELAWIILKGGGLKMVLLFILLQLALLFEKLRFSPLAWLVRRFIPLRAIERCVSGILRGRFKTVFTGFGGATLDVDNAEDYRAIVERFDEWTAYQEEQARMLPAEGRG